MNFGFSGVAQLVEQATVNRWVTGSSPVAGAIFFWYIPYILSRDGLQKVLISEYISFFNVRLQYVYIKYFVYIYN